MDCRVKRNRRRGFLTVFFLAGCCLAGPGCIYQPDLPTIKDSSPAPADVATAENAPKRQPHASTCVAFGDLRATTAADPLRPPLAREQMRDEARRFYQLALKIDPRCQAAYSGLGRLYQATGDYDRAVAAYRQGLEHLPQSASLAFELGVCQARHRDWANAVDSLNIANRLDPENATYAKTLGFCLGRLGRYDECFACLKTVMSEAQAHYDLARMLYYMNQDAACREHLESALKLQPEMAQAQQFLDELQKHSSKPNKSATAAIGFENFIDNVNSTPTTAGPAVDTSVPECTLK